MIIRRMTVVAMLTLVAFVAIAQDRDVPAALRPYMTGEEFRAAGLHKLNPVELAQCLVRAYGRRAPGAGRETRPGASGGTARGTGASCRR